MLVHMLDSSDSTVQHTDTNKIPKSGAFLEFFCKTGIDAEGLIKITPKINWQTGMGIAIAKENPQHLVRSSFPGRRNLNQRGFKRGSNIRICPKW